MDFHEPNLTLRIVGPLTVTDADGSDRTPRGQKAKGLLALLVMAPDSKRSRTWLKDKLWSDRGTVQGSASLRQTLTEVRQAFASLSGCLVTDRQMIALDLRRVTIFRDHQQSGDGASDASADHILFEDLDIRDPEFENWLRDQRTAFSNKAMKSLRTPASNLAQARQELQSDPNHRLKLYIGTSRVSAGSARGHTLADELTDSFTRTVSELGSIDTHDVRHGLIPVADAKDVLHPPLEGLSVHADVREEGTSVTWRLVLSSVANQKTLWSTGFQKQSDSPDQSETNMLRNLNQMVEEVYRSFRSMHSESERRQVATLLCGQGARLVFQLAKDKLLLADRLFEQAFELEPRGLYLAWRAYLRTFLLVEHRPDDRQTVAEEALAYMYEALEMEPQNSYVASFSAHVHAIVRQSYVAAYELAERSITLNRANPLGWACLGIAECNLGKANIGFEHTLKARELVGATPMRFKINLLACIAATMAGNVDGAIRLGEASHGLAPTFKPPLRFLSALYLLRDEHELARRAFDKLKAAEPSFSYEMLRDKSYPASSLHRTKLLENLPRRQM